MASTTLTPPKAPPTAAQLLEKCAADVTDWCQSHRSECRVREDDTPGTPDDVSAWHGIEEEIHLAMVEAVENVLDQRGGPVPAGMGYRTLGSRA